jgi:hypothetical protein
MLRSSGRNNGEREMLPVGARRIAKGCAEEYLWLSRNKIINVSIQ